MDKLMPVIEAAEAEYAENIRDIEEKYFSSISAADEIRMVSKEKAEDHLLKNLKNLF